MHTALPLIQRKSNQNKIRIKNRETFFSNYRNYLRFVGTRSTIALFRMETQIPGSIRNRMKQTTMAIGSNSQCNRKPLMAEITKAKIIARLRPKGFITKPNRI